MAKRSFDPQLAYPEVKLQVRDLVRVVGIVALFAPRGGGAVFGKIRFIGHQGEMGTGDLCRVPSAAVRHGKARQRSGMEPCGECRRVL